MEWWQAVLALCLFWIGYSLGRVTGDMRSRMVQHTLDYFYMTIARDVVEQPGVPFEESFTVRLIQKPFDWQYEDEN